MTINKIFLCLCGVLFVACNSVDKKFLITNESVGELRKGVLISELDNIYKNDSLVKITTEGDFRYNSADRFLVFEKTGEKRQLLEITPNISSESQIVQDVQITDERFTTEHGISLKSTFSEIKKVYKEFEIQTTLMSVIVTPKDSNLYFVFDKSDLITSNSEEHSVESIPDTATIKRLMINWVK